jgi:putative FmdB family regulatory protein
MPIYSYICKNCGAKFDLLVRTNTDEKTCEKCGSKNIERIFAPFAVGKGSSSLSSSLPSCPTGTCPTCF